MIVNNDEPSTISSHVVHTLKDTSKHAASNLSPVPPLYITVIEDDNISASNIKNPALVNDDYTALLALSPTVTPTVLADIEYTKLNNQSGTGVQVMCVFF